MQLPLVTLCVLTVAALTECRQESNSLKMEPPTETDVAPRRPQQPLDPKLRRTLVKVLRRLGGNDRVGAADLTDEEFLRLVGDRASAEDLGTVEASREQLKKMESYPSQEFNYLPPPTDQPQQQSQGKYPATSPTPQQESIFVQYPVPIVSPDIDEKSAMDYPPSGPEEEEDEQGGDSNEDEEEEEEENKNTNTTQTIVDSSSSISTVVEEPKSNNTDKKNLKHEVEFFNSDLVAAFTVQQDDKGVPRKVIPLNYAQNLNSLKRGLEEKEALLERELRLLRQQQEVQERELLRIRAHRGGFANPAEEARRRQQEILFGQQEIYRQQELQRGIELRRQQEQLRRQEQQKQLEYQRQQEIIRQQRFQPPSFDFQPSIVYQIDNRRPPAFPQGRNYFGHELHNRVNRQEPSGEWGNAGINQRPEVRLQSLLLQSGVSGAEPEDVSILSKVLALDHGVPRRVQPNFYGGRHDAYPGPPPF